MKNRLLLLSLAGMALLCYGVDCYDKHPEPGPLKYAFKTDINVTPLKKTYLLADTIWLETDITGKMLYDTISRQFIRTDSAALAMGFICLQLAATNTYPADGLCQVLTPDVPDTYRQNRKGATYASFTNYGCSRSSLKWRIGIKPNYRGNYVLIVANNAMSLQLCGNNTTSLPFYSIQNYQFAAASLNLDVYASLPDSVRRNDDYSTPYFIGKFASRNAFFIKVE